MQVPVEALSKKCQAKYTARQEAAETLRKADAEFEAQYLTDHEEGTRTAVAAKITKGDLKPGEADPNGDILFGFRFGRFSIALAPKKAKKASGKNAITF